MRRLSCGLLACAVAALLGLTGCTAGDADASARPVATAAQAPATVAARQRATGAVSTAPAGRAAASSSGVVAGVDPASGLPEVAESALPPQARRTLALIRAGGPFPYPRSDAQTFGNRERLLPSQPAAYYKEYTVATPGEDDRGPRRIVAGRGGERYYTEDHYESFRRIREGT